MTISLDPKELQIVSDADLIFTKNRIIGKVYNLFGHLSEEYKKITRSEGLHMISENAKISKGENYLGLPYVMLDYPRNFSADNTIAIRTLFWWGNFFSITLQLSGDYQKRYINKLQQLKDNQQLDDWSICINEDQWQHHFQQENYCPLNEYKQQLNALPFIKLAKKIPLNEWDNADNFLISNFTFLIKSIS